MTVSIQPPKPGHCLPDGQFDLVLLHLDRHTAGFSAKTLKAVKKRLVPSGVLLVRCDSLQTTARAVTCHGFMDHVFWNGSVASESGEIHLIGLSWGQPVRPKRKGSRGLNFGQSSEPMQLPRTIIDTADLDYCPGQKIFEKVFIGSSAAGAVLSMFCRPGGHVLDLNAGTGVFGARAKSLGLSYTGIEGNSALAQVAIARINEAPVPLPLFDCEGLQEVMF